MSTSQLDLLLTSTTPACDGADVCSKAEERVRWLILALAVWNTAAAVINYIASIFKLATNVFSATYVANQLQAQASSKSDLALTIPAKQQCVVTQCRATRAPNESLQLTACPSQLTVREAIQHPSSERHVLCTPMMQCRGAQ